MTCSPTSLARWSISSGVNSSNCTVERSRQGTDLALVELEETASRASLRGPSDRRCVAIDARDVVAPLDQVSGVTCRAATDVENPVELGPRQAGHESVDLEPRQLSRHRLQKHVEPMARVLVRHTRIVSRTNSRSDHEPPDIATDDPTEHPLDSGTYASGRFCVASGSSLLVC